MKEISFIHCADIHLDAPFTSLGAAVDKSAVRRRDLRESFQRIIDSARNENVDLLLISGDLYEQEYTKKSTIIFINDCFKSIPGVKVFIVPGNHDPYIANSFYKNSDWNRNVHILTGDRPYVYLEDLDTCIYGIGFKGFTGEPGAAENLPPVDPGRFNILLVHGTVDMCFGKSPYNPLTSGHLASLGMDYVAMGHFHNPVEDMSGKGIIFNPGSPEPLGFDEPGPHGVFKGRISKHEDTGRKSLKVGFNVLSKKHYLNIDVNVEVSSTNEQIIEKINRSLEGYCVDYRSCLLSVTLKGYTEHGFKVDAAQISGYFADRFFFVRIKDETVPGYNLDEIAREPGLRGLYVRKMLSRISGSSTGHERGLLEKALYLGLEALDNGKVDL